MPSIIPGYVYTLFACMVVGALLIMASSMSIANVKNQADLQKLKNVVDSVATEAFELVSQAKTNNLIANVMLDIPISVGNQRYWLRLDNDTFRSWVDIGFGTNPQSNEQRTYIPSMVSASGTFVSGAGFPALSCYRNDSALCLELSGGS
jgi:hypothetical protein